MLVPGLVICGATLIFAHSRTAVAVTGVVIIGLMACLAPFWRAVAMVSAGVGGAMYLATDLYLGVTDSLLNWLATYTARGQTANQLVKLSGREEMWTVMWNSFLESPWIGHGYFVSSSAGELYIWYAWTNWTAHNFWLQILVSTGVVGAALMACALAGLVVRLLSRVTRGAGEWRFAVLVGALLAWQFGWGINNESFAGPLQPESVVFFVILGLAVGRFAEARLARRGQRANGFSRQQNLATR